MVNRVRANNYSPLHWNLTDRLKPFILLIVVDTTVWIDYVRGVYSPYTNALDYELLHNQVVTGDLMEKHLGLLIYKTDAFSQ